MVRDYLEQLRNFHKNNSGSVYALLGYYHLAMQRQVFRRKNVILPTLILAGDIATGKSSIIKQMFSILPHVYTGGEFSRNFDNSATVHSIQARLVKDGTPLVMDPPPIPHQKTDLSDTIDMIYEGKLRDSYQKKNSPLPLSSLILVVQHDYRNLSSFTDTALSKSLILFHEAHEDVDDHATLLDDIDQQILEQSQFFSSIFRYLIRPVDIVFLQQTANAVNKQFVEGIIKDAKKNPRDIHHYTRNVKSAALVVAGFKCFLTAVGFEENERDDYVTFLTDFLFKRSILPTIVALDLGEKERSKIDSVLDDSSIVTEGN